MTKVAIYARYSSDNQREASIEDQVRLCREYAEREGWSVLDCYTDQAISGASLMRPGVQELIAVALSGRFDVILAEAMDRLIRDQEDIAGIYNRMVFAGVKIVTLSEGEVSDLHVGLKGTMNALFLKDLADKTRRGLRGRVEAGKSGGGNSYGYDVVKKFTTDGEPIRGERVINNEQATIVRRIFEEYADGKAPRAIAIELNSEGIPCPSGKAWGPSTIHGHFKRGTGILNNELYVGRLVWNRLHYIKDPDTGKRVSRLNPPDAWVIKDVPELRIIDQALWERVKGRQKSINGKYTKQGDNHFRDRRRPRYLLSGLTKCGWCGGGYVVSAKEYLNCSNNRNKGTCGNNLSIRREVLENAVLKGIKSELFDPESFAQFSKAFTEEVNRARMQAGASLDGKKAELPKIEKKLRKLLDALTEGGSAQVIVAEMQELEKRKEQLEAELREADTPLPLLHPNMATVYADRLTRLYDSLNDHGARDAAADVMRSLIDSVILVPDNGALKARMTGDLAGLLAFVAGVTKPAAGDGDGLSQFELVAGAGFEPATFRL